MYQNKTFAALIPAGGVGKRMGGEIPKQYIPIHGMPMIIWSIKTFAQNPKIDEIIVAVSSEYEEHLHGEICKYLSNLVEKVQDVQSPELVLAGTKVRIVQGGEERQDTVRLGLEHVTSDYVLIHDGARPFAKDDVIDRNIEKVLEDDAVVTVMPVKDTIRTADKTLKRDELYLVQTPQTFKTSLIKEAHEMAHAVGYYGTDDASLVERIGQKVELVEGDYSNIKITTKEDLPMTMRVGTGYDVHQLVENRKLILGGVDIPHDKGLLGHSDADVLVHALMDAMLGAASLGDIGKHFPDTDEKHKGISSIKLLELVSGLLHKEGYSVVNCDITVICQKPKLLPHIEQMRKNIAHAIGIKEDAVSIKGTTTEKLGFAGREEGIAAEAVCLLKR